MVLKRDPADPAPAQEALQAAIAVAKQQGTRSFELRAALALAKLYQSTGRSADAYAALAPAVEGFAPTPEMPEIAEAQTLMGVLSQAEEVRAEATQRRRMTQLQVAYGNALIAARGHGAAETTEAFAKARESASGETDAPERLAADYGLWVGSHARGDLPSMRAHATAFLSDVEARPDSPEAGVAHRAAGLTCWFAGEYREARDHLERALALFQPGRDDDLAFRFGQDQGVAAMAYLAIASWPIGEVDRAISLIDRMQMRVAGLTHVGTLAYGRYIAAIFELTRRDPACAAPNAFELARLAREHDLRMFRALGVFLEGWATAASGAPGGGLEDMRRGRRAAARTERSVFRRAIENCAVPRRNRGRAIRRAPSQSSTKRWRRATAWALARSKRNCTGCAATPCSSATPRTPPQPSKLSWPPSPSRRSKVPAASDCARRCRSPSSIRRPAAPPKPAPSSSRRSKALRQRRKCLRSQKRRRC
jgi:tetratricopeptide (TPR) repeat protein